MINRHINRDKVLKEWLYGIYCRNAAKFQGGILQDYERLIGEKERRKISVKRIPASVIKDFPKCEFLEIKTEQEARAFLESLSNRELKLLVDEVEQAVSYNYVFNTIKTWVIDAEAQIRQYDERRLKRRERFYEGYYRKKK